MKFNAKEHKAWAKGIVATLGEASAVWFIPDSLELYKFDKATKTIARVEKPTITRNSQMYKRNKKVFKLVGWKVVDKAPTDDTEYTAGVANLVT